MEYKSVWNKNISGRFGTFAVMTILLLAMVALLGGCEVTQRNAVSARQVSIEAYFVVGDKGFMEAFGVDEIKKTYFKPDISYEFLDDSKSIGDNETVDLARRTSSFNSDGIIAGYLDNKVVADIRQLVRNNKDTAILAAPQIAGPEGQQFFSGINLKGNTNYLKDVTYQSDTISSPRDTVDAPRSVWRMSVEDMNSGLEFMLIPGVHKDSGDVDVELDCILNDKMILKRYWRGPVKVKSFSNLRRTAVKLRVEIPEDKTLMILGIKTDKGFISDLLYDYDKPDPYGKDDINSSRIDDMIILITPKIVKPKNTDDRAVSR